MVVRLYLLITSIYICRALLGAEGSSQENLSAHRPNSHAIEKIQISACSLAEVVPWPHGSLACLLVCHVGADTSEDDASSGYLS